MQPIAPVSFLSFLGLREGPKMGVFSTLSTKSQTFYTINCFFLIAPRDFHYYWASAQPCADKFRR